MYLTMTSANFVIRLIDCGIALNKMFRYLIPEGRCEEGEGQENDAARHQTGRRGHATAAFVDGCTGQRGCRRHGPVNTKNRVNLVEKIC